MFRVFADTWIVWVLAFCGWLFFRLMRVWWRFRKRFKRCY